MVKYLGCSDAQVRWGSNDDPRECGLVIGKSYELERKEEHSWHTKYYLVEFPGKKFNSVCFDVLP